MSADHSACNYSVLDYFSYWFLVLSDSSSVVGSVVLHQAPSGLEPTGLSGQLGASSGYIGSPQCQPQLVPALLQHSEGSVVEQMAGWINVTVCGGQVVR